MKRLILVRHAKAEPLTDAENDFERQLKKRGGKDVRLISDHLIGKRIVPQLIISSPAIRALQTARIMAGAYSIPEADIIEAPFLYSGYTVEQFLLEVTRLAGDLDSVMVVGHNPEIALTAFQLTGDHFFDYPTSATAILAFSTSEWSQIKAGNGRTELFVFPKELKKKNGN
ncbi:SixA phosphatase family protein [Thermophagus sp. OGC60D27]|uniref:SixA phosphatase family protein n=1 Tax=Thermophagus sp. OGC60D27 TaxID=3458415 RepID=UPI004038385E